MRPVQTPDISGQDIIAQRRALAADMVDADVMAALDAAAAEVDRAPARARKTFMAEVKKCGQSEAALRLLDWGAELLREANNLKNGTALFNAARTLERRLGVDLPGFELPNEQRFVVYRRFNQALMLEEPQLRKLIKDVAKARDRAACEPLLELCVDWLEMPRRAFSKDNPNPPYSQSYDRRMGVLTEALVKEMGKLGKAVERPELEGELVRRGLTLARTVEPAVWERNADVLKAELAKSSDLRDATAWLFPKDIDGAGNAWRQMLLSCGVVDHLATLEAEAVVKWLRKMICWVLPREADFVPWLDDVMSALAPVAKRSKTPLDVTSRGDRHRPDIDIGVIDLLLEHEIPLQKTDDATFDIRTWSRRDPRRRLEYMAGDERWAKHVQLSYRRFNGLGKDQAIRKAVMASAAAEAVFDAEVAKFRALLTEAPLARLDQDLDALNAFMIPENLTALPSLATFVGQLDVAEMLARNLRAGIMDEWCWPAQDEVNDGFESDVGQYDTDGPFPWFVMLKADSETGGRTASEIVVLGPEGEVFRERLDEGPAYARSMRYVDGDVFLCTSQGSLKLGLWVSNPKDTFKARLYANHTTGFLTPEGALWEGKHLLRKGEPTIVERSCANAFTDGQRFWVDGKEINPDSGRRRRKGLPAWLDETACSDEEAANSKLLPWACMYWPLPEQLSQSPLGVKDGQAGIRVREMADGTHLLETIDGRRWRGRLPGKLQPQALLTFPGRTEPCVYARRSGEEAIFLADGSHPVVPARRNSFDFYWTGAPQWLPLMWWHYLVPRDLEGSQALANCSTEQARSLLDAASGEQTDHRDDTVVLETGPEVTATLQRAPRRAGSTLSKRPGLAAAIDRVFPTMSARRLKEGLAGIIERAAMLENQVRQWQASARRRPAPIEGGLLDADVVGLGSILGGGWRHAQDHFEGSILSAEAFLNDGDGAGTNELVATPMTSSRIPWQGLLVNLGAVVRQLLSPATPGVTRQQLQRALSVWADTDFAANAERYRLLGLTMSSPPPNTAHTSGDIAITKNGRYVLRTRDWSGRYGFGAIERADDDGDFRDPDWASIDWTTSVRDGCWHGQKALRSALELSRAERRITWDGEIGRRISEATGLLPATAARLWVGAVGGAYTVERDLRQTLGCKVADLELALTEIPTDWQELYEQSMPADPAALFEPLDDDGTGQSPVERFIEVWTSRYGVRAPLDADTVRRLQWDFHNKTDTFHLDVRVFEEPDKHAFLTTDERWVVHPWTGFLSGVSYMRGFIPPGWPKFASQHPDDGTQPDPQRAFTGWVLRNFLRFVSWAHLELPVGHRYRAGLARLCELVRARLSNPDLLLLAGAIDLSEELEPKKLAADFESILAGFAGSAGSAGSDRQPYEAVDGGKAAPGIDRGDIVVTWPTDHKNSFFIAFRPAQVADPERFAAMARDLGVYDVFKRSGGGCSCGLNFGRHKVIDMTDLPAWLVWRAEGFQRLVERLAADADERALEAGSFESDPRVSAPAVVAEVQDTLDISPEAATLLLQLMTLPEPSDKRVLRYNGWKKKRLTAVRKKLLARGLCEEAKVKGTSRTLFVPGDLAFLTSPARTMEASKLALYGLEADERGRFHPPFGVVLPLRPLPELFAEAWRGYRARRVGQSRS